MSKADFLLEIGSEEIPAGYIEPALAELSLRLTNWFTEHGLEFDSAKVATYATPRRLTVLVGDLSLEQPRREELRLGPPVKVAYDADGSLTKAGEGFARSAGIAVDQLERVETDKGERLAARVAVGGASTRELLLSDLDLADLLQLGFPKTMRWIIGSNFRFARPIRWLVALLGDEVLPLELLGITASAESRGQRTLSPGAVKISNPSSYLAELEAVNVIADIATRRDRIAKEAHAQAAALGGQLHQDEELLAEVANLVEYPTPVLGSFESERVDQLPAEVIITAMRSHQRYFSIEKTSGGLLPSFLTFRDGGDKSLKTIAEGNERVLRARLSDAAFYWDEDCKMSSEEKLEHLDRVVWLEGLGSMKAKCERIEVLSLWLASELQIEVDEAQLRRSARLCKTDLATEMIRDGKEFTKLQGVIGRYYALEAGETEPVADAIREHLHPKSASDRLPEGSLGLLVGLADRLDSIVGCVLAGFAPTGGQDPYAVRRQALAVLRILSSLEQNVDIERVVESALGGYEVDGDRFDSVRDGVTDLFWVRLESMLSDLPVEIVRGVLSVSILDPVDNIPAARALDAMRGSESFDRLLEGAKRCRNILVKEERLEEESLEGAARARLLREKAQERWQAWRGHADSGPAPGFDPSLMDEDAERALHSGVLDRVFALASASDSGDPEAVFAALAELGPIIARFFDEVLVNAPNEAVRANRLGFLESVHYLFAKFADLSRVSAAG